jgi:hypothetical protein
MGFQLLYVILPLQLLNSTLVLYGWVHAGMRMCTIKFSFLKLRRRRYTCLLLAPSSKDEAYSDYGYNE